MRLGTASLVAISFAAAKQVERGELGSRELMLATFLWGFGSKSANRRRQIVPNPSHGRRRRRSVYSLSVLG